MLIVKFDLSDTVIYPKSINTLLCSEFPPERNKHIFDAT